MNINEIKPYNKNAKEHNPKQIKLIAESIKRFGFNQPIVIDKNNEIVAGHGRYEGAKLLGMEDVPILKVETLTDEEVKAYRLADNQINAMTGNNMQLVIDELKLLPDELFDLTGFDRIILEVEEDDFNAEEEYNKITEPITKIGDIYQLGQHTLVCGDSTQPEAYLGLMGDDKADLIFTDPPYNVDYASIAGNSYSGGKYGDGNKIFNDKKTDIEFQQFIQNMTKQCFDFSNKGASLYMWYATKNHDFFKLGMTGGGWRYLQDIVWVKERFVFSFGQQYHRAFEPCMIGVKDGKYKKNKKYSNISDVWETKEELGDMVDVWYLRRDATQSYVHPTQKPIKLCERALRRNTEQKDIVLDAFGGSGSTLIACEQMDRRARLIELDSKYCDVIILRYCQWMKDFKIKKNGEDYEWKLTKE